MQGLYTFQIPTHKLSCRCFFNSSHEYKNNQLQYRYIPYSYLVKFFNLIYLFLASGAGGNGSYEYLLKKNNIAQQSNTTGSFNIVANSNEIYTVVITDYCTIKNDSASVKIKVFNTLQFTQTLPNVYLCPNESITLKAITNKGSGTVGYLWVDAATNTTLSTTDTLQFIPTTSAQIILKVTDACMSIYDTAWLYQFAAVSGTQLNSDVISGCVALTVNFETPPLTYSNNQPCQAEWDFGDGTSSTQNFTNSSATLKSKHTYLSAGVYQAKVEVRFTKSTKACFSFTASVEALIIPQITLRIAPPKITLPKTQCTATMTTTNADSVVIDWADGFKDNFNVNLSVITQTHDYADTGHYIVKATAYNKNTCYTETRTSVNHADTFMCFIPNVFTPNKDATNETFKPVVSYCKSYELTIFNCWGQEVYKTNYASGKNPQPAWSGEGCEMGTYLYLFTAVDEDNMRHNYKGTVMLLR